jgi:hypothetical protein
MTQDEIIEMAIQGHASTRDAIHWAMNQERKACAKLFELTDLGGLKSDVWLQNYTATILDGYAKAIRARGQA